MIIPAFNAAATIGRTLHALAAQDLAEAFEVIVVDDGSSDETVEIVRHSSLSPLLIEASNEGPGPARNRGVEAAKTNRIAFTDADCRPDPGWLTAGLRALGDADLVQGSVRAEQVTRGPFDRTVWVTREAGLYECASLFVRRDLFEQLGGFEDWLGARIGKPLAEDAWLGWRARRAGATVSFDASASVEHAVFPRSLTSFAAERLRLVYFPAIVAKIPELRGSLLFARLFLSRSSAAFDLLVASLVAMLLLANPLLALGVAPYLADLAARSLRWRRRAPLAALGGFAADAVGFGALIAGSIRFRRAVL